MTMTLPPRPPWQGPRSSFVSLTIALRRPVGAASTSLFLSASTVWSICSPAFSSGPLPLSLSRALSSFLPTFGRPLLAPHQNASSQQPKDDHTDDELVHHVSPVTTVKVFSLSLCCGPQCARNPHITILSLGRYGV